MVGRQRYVPDRGDVVWLDFQPTRGHEQSGRRPAIILSPRSYNRLVGLAVVCPITSSKKGYTFEVPILVEATISVILSDHVRSLDWKARNVKFILKADADTIVEVIENIKALFLK